MQTYRRFVSYVYQYENGKKAGNRGFIKVEARGNTCSMQISLKGICKDENASCTVYGFKREDGLLKGSLLAECPVKAGVVQEQLVFPRNEMGKAEYGLQELSGVIFQGNDQTMYGTQWDDDPMKMENFQPDEKNEAVPDENRALEEEEKERERWDQPRAGKWVADGALPDSEADSDEPEPAGEEAEEVNVESPLEMPMDSQADRVQPEQGQQPKEREWTKKSETGAEAAEEIPAAAQMPSEEEISMEAGQSENILETGAMDTTEEEMSVETESVDGTVQDVEITDILDTTVPASELPVNEPEEGMQPEGEMHPGAGMEPETEMRPEGGMEPETGMRPERGMEPETEMRPERGMEPETGMRPERGMEPETEMRLEKGMQPEGEMRPGRGMEPETGMRPERGMEPEEGMEPETEMRPGAGMEPETGMRPERGMEPETGMRPERGMQPEGGMRPGTEMEPGTEIRPERGMQPEGKVYAEKEVRSEKNVQSEEVQVQPEFELEMEIEPEEAGQSGRNPQPEQKPQRETKDESKRGAGKNIPRNFCPFSDGVLEDCQRIKINDLRFLDTRDQNLRNNRFVQHGYQMFGHLLLAKIARNGQYILGVPGMYQQQEKFMAEMFGFHNFKYAKRGAPKQPGFGYWYRLIYPPKPDRGNGRPKQS